MVQDFALYSFFLSSQNAIFALKHKLESNTQRTQLLSHITIRYFQYDEEVTNKQKKHLNVRLGHGLASLTAALAYDSRRLQIYQKNPPIFIRIAALASRKRSNKKVPN